MDPYEELAADSMRRIVIGSAIAPVRVGADLVRAHEMYHRHLHTPRAHTNSQLWLQLAFLNYSAFMCFGWASLMLDSMMHLEATRGASTTKSLRDRAADVLASITGDLRRLLRKPLESIGLLETTPAVGKTELQLHLQHAWTTDSVLARIGSALDAIAGGLRGLLSADDPLDVKSFFERLIDDKGKWTFRLRPNATAEAARYVPLLQAAMNDLAEFRLYRNKTVHTTFLSRYHDGTGLHLVNLSRIYPGKFDGAAFQRIYGANLPVYGGKEDPQDYHPQPVSAQLESYLATAFRHAAALENKMGTTYGMLVKPTL